MGKDANKNNVDAVSTEVVMFLVDEVALIRPGVVRPLNFETSQIFTVQSDDPLARISLFPSQNSKL